jgi:hypothetical protein
MVFKRSHSPTIFVPSPYRRYGPDGRVIDLNRQSIAYCQLDFAPSGSTLTHSVNNSV